MSPAFLLRHDLHGSMAVFPSALEFLSQAILPAKVTILYSHFSRETDYGTNIKV